MKWHRWYLRPLRKCTVAQVLLLLQGIDDGVSLSIPEVVYGVSLVKLWRRFSSRVI